MKHMHFLFPDGMLKTMLPVGSALFAPSFRKQLTAVFGYDTDRAKAITKKAKPAYRKIIDGLPEFEKGDRFKMNLVNCAMIGAFILSMPKHPDVKRPNVVVNAKTPYLAFCKPCEKRLLTVACTVNSLFVGNPDPDIFALFFEISVF